MFEFWEAVIKPLLSVAKPKTLVEVGAEEGGHTQQLAKWASERRATLHVIDPVPRFDVEVFERTYPARFVMHQALSLEALPGIQAPDVVLLDGDHNWYTVIEELRIIGRSAKHWPVTLVHDVEWPYGRRDMYYSPDNVPAEHRQPFERSGMRPRVSRLSADGFNPGYANAVHEGGPRNGVLTAVEDFMDESPHDLHLFCVRGPAGLGLLVDAKTLKTRVGRAVEHFHDQAYALELSPRYASRYFD